MSEKRNSAGKDLMQQITAALATPANF